MVEENKFYVMMQLLKLLVRADEIEKDIADKTALNLAKKYGENPIYLW
ncbi:MAG: hypothetical protein R3Y35_10810 [Clostridia bacterium]